MSGALAPEIEHDRMTAVRRYDVLDTPPDGVFDRLTALAARHFGVPISIVSIVDTDRIWFKSHHGIDVTEIGRSPGLCASAILQHDPWIVEDAAIDPRTLANPLVAGELGLRFYVGVPLTTTDGYNLGTFCIIDSKPRTVSTGDLAFLEDLASVVMDQLELRLAARRTVERELALRQQAEDMARNLQQSVLPPEIPTVDGADVAVRWQPAKGGEVGGDFYDVFEAGDGQQTVVVGDVCGKGLGAATVTALARYTLRAAALQTTLPSQAVQLLNAALLQQHHDDERFVTVTYVAIRMRDRGALATISRAGHVPTLVRRADGTVERFSDGTIPVGLFADLEVHDVEVELGPDDALVLYTDGVTEARRGREEFGLQRLERVVADSGGLGAEDTAGAIEHAVAAFQDGLPADDIAILVFKLSG